MCFIRSKMYSYIKLEDADTTSNRKSNYGRYNGVAAKGVKKSAIKYLTHDKYKRCLLSENKDDRLIQSSFYRIESKDHQLQTIHQTKNSLSHYDDKRYYLDAIHSRAHGHYMNSGNGSQ